MSVHHVDWPAPPGVHAVFTTRGGGASAAPFDSFNLGDHVGDAPASVAANRVALAQALAAQPVFLHQVHGTVVADLDTSLPDGTTADACLVTRAGVAATVMVADCLPVLLTDVAGRVVAAAHAGWRGLAGEGGVGVLETTVTAMRERVGPEAELLAWLGPCIGPRAFEVGAEVRAAFCDRDVAMQAHFQPGAPDKYWADLPGIARRRLQALGLSRLYGNDGSPNWCTVTQASVFFSHRRDAVRLGGSGRMAACIWRV